MKPTMFTPYWEYDTKSFKNWELHQDPNVINRDGWEVISVCDDTLFPGSLLVSYKRELEFDNEENPWSSQYNNWVKHRSEILKRIDNIKKNIKLLYTDMDSYYGSTEKSDKLYHTAHALTDGFVLVNQEEGARESMQANDAGALFVALCKIQKETNVFNKLINLIKKDCDLIFYYVFGYDIRDAEIAPDMMNYFFGNNIIGRVLRSSFVSSFISSFMISSILSILCVLLVNLTSHIFGNQQLFWRSDDMFAHYFELLMIQIFPLTACFMLADKFREESGKQVRLFGWRKLNWGIFMIRSKVMWHTRRILQFFCITN